MAKVLFHKQPSYLQLLSHIEKDPYKIPLPDRKAQQFWESQYNVPEYSSAVVDAATWDHEEQGMYVPPQARAFNDVQEVGAPPPGPGPGMGPWPGQAGPGAFGGDGHFRPPPPGGGGYGPARRGRPTQPGPYADGQGPDQADADLDFGAHQGGMPPWQPWQGPAAAAEQIHAAQTASAAHNTLNHMWWAAQAPQPIPQPQTHDHGPTLAHHAVGLASTAGASLLAAASNYARGEVMGALNQHVVQPIVQPITANIAQGAQAFGQAVAHGLGIGGAAPPAVNNPGLYETLLGGAAPEAVGEAGMVAAGAVEGAEIGAFGGPLGAVAGAGLGVAAAAAAAASNSWWNHADPNTSASSSSHQAPILVAHGDAWHNSANASLPPAAQAHMNATGHYIPAPPPRKRAAEFFSLDEDGFTADDEDMPTRGTRRPAAAAAADRGKKGKYLHDRKWEGKDRAPPHSRARSKFQATLPVEPIQGFTSSSDSSSGVVVATTRPPPPPPPPEQGNGYLTDYGASSRRVRPHALPQHGLADPVHSSGSDGPGASAGPSSLKTLQSALKRATKAKETILGPMATNYRNTPSTSSSSRGPLSRPPPPPPPDSDASNRSRDRNTSARSGQR